MSVSSFVIYILPALPNMVTSALSKLTPTSSLITVAPVNTAISFNIAFLLSPKDGALTAQTLIPALILLTIKLANG
jgi:hypothetical protein